MKVEITNKPIFTIMRNIKKKHSTVYEPIGDLSTYRALPTRSINQLDPFLFLNHHGPQTYPPNNQGLPFGPHPHRGFETLTYIMKGDIVHRDTGGYESIIKEGGIQWMTAGSGLIHAEVSSEEFKEHGGEEEVIQLWLNLPAKYKMTKPTYVGLPYDKILHIEEDQRRATVHLISGNWKGRTGPVNSLSGLTMTSIELKPEAALTLEVPASHQILFYVARGSVAVNGEVAALHELVEFEQDGERLEVKAQEATYLIFGHGAPFDEPIVAQGPFVMNSEAEIMQAYQDYRSGKMGVW